MDIDDLTDQKPSAGYVALPRDWNYAHVAATAGDFPISELVNFGK